MSTSTEREQVGSDAAEEVVADGSGAADLAGGQGDALPVLAQEARVVRPESAFGDLSRGRETLPAVQAAAVAAGGFVAGAAVVGLVTRRQRRVSALARGRQGARLGRGRRRSSNAGELVQIVGSRSLLLDVHLLGGRD